jgi:hypothetical protein
MFLIGGPAAIEVFDMTIVLQVHDFDEETNLYTVTLSKSGEQRSHQVHQAEILTLPYGKRELRKFNKLPPASPDTDSPLLATLDANWPFDITGEPIVTVELKKKLIGDFLNATSASALALRVCAVCEGHILQSKGRTLPLSDIPNVHVLHKHMTTEPCLYKEDIDANGNSFLCRPCELSLNKGRPPPCSIFNVPLGELPDELKDLTFPEMMLISPVMCKSYVLKLVSFAGPQAAQRAVKGNCIAFMSDIPSVVKQVLLSLHLVKFKPVYNPCF